MDYKSIPAFERLIDLWAEPEYWREFGQIYGYLHKLDLLVRRHKGKLPDWVRETVFPCISCVLRNFESLALSPKGTFGSWPPDVTARKLASIYEKVAWALEDHEEWRPEIDFV